MAISDQVKTDPNYPIPDTMKAWVLGDPGELTFAEKPVPSPKKAEVLVRIDAVAICAAAPEQRARQRPSLEAPGTAGAGCRGLGGAHRW